MNKKVLWILLAVVLCAVIIPVLITYASRGYLFVGDGWGDTQAQALSKAAHSKGNPKETLTMSILLESRDLENGNVLATYISKANTLVMIVYEKNEKGQFHVAEYIEETSLETPTVFVLNGNPDQHPTTPYQQYGSLLIGWSTTGTKFTINGKSPTRKTYIFENQGQSQSLDCWWINNFAGGEVQLEYVD